MFMEIITTKYDKLNGKFLSFNYTNNKVQHWFLYTFLLPFIGTWKVDRNDAPVYLHTKEKISPARQLSFLLTVFQYRN